VVILRKYVYSHVLKKGVGVYVFMCVYMCVYVCVYALTWLSLAS
jgi:hypothetical protein